MRTFVIAVVLVAFALPAGAFEVFELNVPGRGYDPSWPPDGSPWHTIDPCENIQIDGVWKHIEWIGPTFTISRPGAREPILVEPIDGARQTQYHIIFPPEAFCVIVHTDQPIVEVCQYVVILEPPEYAGEWHVEEIDTNIHTNGGSPVEQSTWSQIKGWFQNLIN